MVTVDVQRVVCDVLVVALGHEALYQIVPPEHMDRDRVPPAQLQHHARRDSHLAPVAVALLLVVEIRVLCRLR
eukprot:12424515-Karenia_brevis.AAC.1